MKKIIFVLFIAAQAIFSQQNKPAQIIPRDTSYTLYSATLKIQKHFPFAKPVSSAIPKNVTVKKNLVYTKYGGRKLHIDIFMPAGKKKGPFPAVLLIHGGGWSSGNRTMTYPMAERLSEHGFVTAPVEYRLSPEAKFPASIYDLKAAIRWLRANAAEFNINSKMIAVYGCSSGGHLAAFIGATNGIKKFEGPNENRNFSSSVEAAIDIDGILDFTTPEESGHDNNPLKPSPGKKWLGASIKENIKIWREASPINYIGKNTAPMLFVNSSFPRFHAGRDSVMNMLASLNIYSEKNEIPGTPHMFWLFHPWFEQTLDYVLAFLNKIFEVKAF